MNLLHDIQQELKVPKNQFNKFGNYNYRNVEDILEAVKPLLKGKGTLTINDEIVEVGGRIYVKATATLTHIDYERNGKDPEYYTWSATAYAREPEKQAGMSEAQLTGSTSSYARKYSLNALLSIDDTKDTDSMGNGSETPKKGRETASKVLISNVRTHSGEPENEVLTEEKFNAMLAAIEKGEGEQVRNALPKYNVSEEQLKELNKRLK